MGITSIGNMGDSEDIGNISTQLSAPEQVLNDDDTFDAANDGLDFTGQLSTDTAKKFEDAHRDLKRATAKKILFGKQPPAVGAVRLIANRKKPVSARWQTAKLLITSAFRGAGAAPTRIAAPTGYAGLPKIGVSSKAASLVDELLLCNSPLAQSRAPSGKLTVLPPDRVVLITNPGYQNPGGGVSNRRFEFTPKQVRASPTTAAADSLTLRAINTRFKLALLDLGQEFLPTSARNLAVRELVGRIAANHVDVPPNPTPRQLSGNLRVRIPSDDVVVKNPLDTVKTTRSTRDISFRIQSPLKGGSSKQIIPVLPTEITTTADAGQKQVSVLSKLGTTFKRVLVVDGIIFGILDAVAGVAEAKAEPPLASFC
jgi:hypothetical protein